MTITSPFVRTVLPEGRALELLNAATELDQPGADRGIGDAFKAARDQLVNGMIERRDAASST
jgi:hypothetical protein